MKLKSLTIKNFKGIDEEGITIDFAPITLLFGPNNAGKSTIIQALHLAREVFCEKEPDLDHLEKYGKGFNIGSFKDYVHKHEMNRTISIKLDFDDVTIPYTNFGMQNSELFDTFPAIDDIVPEVKTLALEINLSWDFTQRKPLLSRYFVYLNNHLFTCIELDSKSLNGGVSLYNHICYPDAFISEESHSKINKISSELKSMKRKSAKKIALASDLHDAVYDSIPPILHQFVEMSSIISELGGEKEKPFSFSFKYNLIKNNFPLWGEYINFDYINKPMFYEIEGFYDGFRINCNETFSRLISVTGKIVGDELNKLLYIGPMREIPARGPILPQRITHDRWATGLAAWDILIKAEHEHLSKFNKKLETLGLPFDVEVQDFSNNATNRKIAQLSLPELESHEMQTILSVAEKKGSFEELSAELAKKLQKIFEENQDLFWTIFAGKLQGDKLAQLFLKHNKTNVLTEPHDMGLGVSQIIPFIAAMEFAQKNAFIAIEQPELHIHPKLQVNLGDVIIESALNSENMPFFLIETHSEHLLLRLLRRIRNTSEGSASDKLKLTPQDIAINWIGPTAPDEEESTRQTYTIRLDLDEDGSFNTPWPEGFFDERGEEIFG